MKGNILQGTEDSQQPEGRKDWMWQQRNAVRTVDQLLEVFPGLSRETCDAITRSQKQRRFQITRYYLEMIRRTADGLAPLPDDPLWRQTAPIWNSESEPTLYAYDGETENWELPSEMVTPIAQHKYDNRIIIRLANVCHAYCQFCYEALRTLEKDSVKASFQQKYWEETVDYVRSNKQIEEVILSGGEPLMQSDDQLDKVLSDLRGVGRPIAIRIHTRTLTYNPFRITDGLIELFDRYRLTAIGLHVAHPNELTDTFVEMVWRLSKVIPIMFANIPLLRGINDDVEVIRDLGMRLYCIGVMSGYLYHFMPYSPGAAEFRTPIRTGVDIVHALKRHISNLAVPEFVLPHHTGKHSMPLLAGSERPPERGVDANDHPVLRYTNWRGELVEYPDET